ncbi:MAG: polyamine aminopropyltransferase [Deltaproteobacteria bacterium]|nr:polyamine aminopropyltransferase [Candidatus Anaeroferrophillus wilburensis]MBN2890112.1 polyamine aminopropyltransferase [Deltaproteobacteria bacterium]
MELWYTEEHSSGTRFSLRATRHVHQEKTPFQQLDVIETEEYGRIMLLDGLVMLTEKDEFVYHELITHVPSACLPDARRVLVIGGGDGGTARELLRYPQLTRVDMVEIDEAVVMASRKFFPTLNVKLDDPRLTIHYRDGMEFVKEHENQYDLIIVDSTDPIGPGEHLFTESFYRDCYAALRPQGILVSQAATSFSAYYLKLQREQCAFVKAAFDRLFLYLGHIPTYPTGTWSFLCAVKGDINPAVAFDRRSTTPFTDQLGYYNAGMHRQAFSLPNFIYRELAGLIDNQLAESV